jgi:hypothetical protein
MRFPRSEEAPPRRRGLCLSRRRLLVVALVVAGLIGPVGAHAAGEPEPRIRTEQQATKLFLGNPSVAKWLERYPREAVVAQAEFKEKLNRWDVSVHYGEAGQIAGGKVDPSGFVIEALVGPEVAWPLARGIRLGESINRPLVWLSFCAVFFVCLANFRRPLSMRNVDVLAVLSFSIYLWLFNDGRVFASTIAASVALTYLLLRCAWIGITGRVSPGGPLLPVWLLVSLLVFAVGFRIGLNDERSHVLDVGYAGVIGADRLANGETPYGNFPRRDTGKPCAEPDAEGDIGDWIQDNGRCETANALGDTYGPVNYHAYLPGLWLFGWSGKWDSLPAVHFTALLFDVLAILGLAAIGYRFGRMPLALTLALAWAANPLTQYPSMSNTNDAIMPALLIWGFWAASSAAGRGAFLALAGWTKLAALVVVPLWLTYPRAEWRKGVVFSTAFVATTLVSFWALFVSGDPLHEFRVFYERTFEIQAERSSPFSLWDWGDYHAAGLPDLKWLQRSLQLVLVVAAVTVAFVPRSKSPLQLAALTGALLIAFELLLTHWAALYIVWFYPFVALATVTGTALSRSPAPVPEREAGGAVARLPATEPAR